MDQFLDSLINFDKENIAENNLKAVRPYLDDKEFDPDFIRSKSAAAAGAIILYICVLKSYISTLYGRYYSTYLYTCIHRGLAKAA